MSVEKSLELDIGWEAPDFNLLDTNDEEWTLDRFKNHEGILVVFTCNHCPYARAAWPQLIDLYELYGEDLGFVAINSNDPEVYSEDSYEEMKNKVVEWQIPFPYLLDDTQETAEDYQAQCTPDVYLFKNEDGVFKLFYHGRINDNWQHPEQVEENSLEDAIVLLLEDESPPEVQYPSMGCSIKWKT